MKFLNTNALVVAAVSIAALTTVYTSQSKQNNPTQQGTTEVEKIEIAQTTTTPVPSAQTKASDKLKVTRLAVEPEQVILLNTEVNEYSVEIIIAKIEELSNKYKNLYLVLDSPGGSVFDGSRLISYMESSKANVNTVCYGLCASMAAQIFSHGKQRLMINRSTLMYHPASGGVRGTVHEMKSLLGYIDRETQKLDAYVADRAGITRDKFADLVLQNLWIAADDAISMHLADGLVIVPVNYETEEVVVISDELIKRGITTGTTPKTTNPLKEIF